MIVPTHMLAGVTLLYLLSLTWPGVFSVTAPQLVLATLFSLLPDIDALRRWRIDHSDHSRFHAPLPWVGAGLLLLPAVEIGLPAWVPGLLVAATLVHIGLDYVSTVNGPMLLLYPFSDRGFLFWTLERPAPEDAPLMRDAVRRVTWHWERHRGLLLLRIVAELGIGIAGLYLLL